MGTTGDAAKVLNTKKSKTKVAIDQFESTIANTHFAQIWSIMKDNFCLK